MIAGIAEYVPVIAPTKSKKGWNFPYNGNDWPAEDGFYWVWACKPDRSPDSVFMLPVIAWWNGRKQEFPGLRDKVVYAWHKAIHMPLLQENYHE